MRFAVLAPRLDTVSLARVRSELYLFNIEIALLARSPRADVDVVDDLVEGVLEELTCYGPWDGVLLAVDAGERVPCTSARLAERVRRILGPNVPVASVDDVQTNRTQQLVDSLTMLWVMRAMAVDAAAEP